ncbi:hypothetical protein AMTRI_Chr04g183660 [Amborella trichopoda]|uniref:Peptidase A1 domain-containing protein n=1 Tax=Amborella trichopoda TaxID=13333 RepID=W1NIV3_AMBTC|nr:aspartic proteinase nepenthesin-1 [Amborella trichopoda]ERM95453.1 hypothetical protein AMTR_s00008p00256490 [Amborella trichopoda]|eukprot:XP_006828037.1 aspartic proteinase nepenthesin-1 [Amborella trichopoda]
MARVGSLVMASMVICAFMLDSSASKIPESGIRVDLVHVDAGLNFTALQRLQRAVTRGKLRLEKLQSKTTAALDGSGEVDIEAPVHVGNGEFLMKLAIGTPPVSYSAIVDTGSDLVWTQCLPCDKCFKQPTPIFDPAKSSTFGKLSCKSDLCQALPSSTCDPDCEYVYTYGDYSSTQGTLATELFTFGGVSVSEVGFGCGNYNQGRGFSQGAGLVGLGRGPLSLITQLGGSVANKFSYCLKSIDDSDSATSPLLLGAEAKTTGEVITTPLVRNPEQFSFYYITLEGISVGGYLLPIKNTTFEMKADGNGGMIVDSGTTITYLEVAGYREVRKAFLSKMKTPETDGSATGLDLCFSLPSSATEVEVPTLTLHFGGGGSLELPAENYFIADESTGLLCLAMMPASGMSILGNVQQQNFLVQYDLGKELLSFTSAQCDKL